MWNRRLMKTNVNRKQASFRARTERDPIAAKGCVSIAAKLDIMLPIALKRRKKEHLWVMTKAKAMLEKGSMRWRMYSRLLEYRCPRKA